MIPTAPEGGTARQSSSKEKKCSSAEKAGERKKEDEKNVRNLRCGRRLPVEHELEEILAKKMKSAPRT
jgi:hypothetical protein